MLANRSACFLKLGDHGRALEDAAAAAGFDDTYAKAHFRRGLALRALGRSTAGAARAREGPRPRAEERVGRGRDHGSRRCA